MEAKNENDRNRTTEKLRKKTQLLEPLSNTRSTRAAWVARKRQILLSEHREQRRIRAEGVGEKKRKDKGRRKEFRKRSSPTGNLTPDKTFWPGTENLHDLGNRGRSLKKGSGCRQSRGGNTSGGDNLRTERKYFTAGNSTSGAEKRKGRYADH